MKTGERWIAKGEPEFVVEVISTDFVGITSADPEASFQGRVISFPKRPKDWTNSQRVGREASYWTKDFIPDEAWNKSMHREKRINEILEK